MNPFNHRTGHQTQVLHGFSVVDENQGGRNEFCDFIHPAHGNFVDLPRPFAAAVDTP